MGSFFNFPYSYGVSLVEEMRRDLGEEGLTHMRHVYRVHGLRRFASALIGRKHKAGGQRLSEALYNRIAAYGEPTSIKAGIPEFESLRGFKRLATELFGEPEAKNDALPYLLNGRARPIPGADPEPDQ